MYEGHGHGAHAHLGHVPDAAAPAVFAARSDVAFDPPARTDQVETAVLRFSAALADALRAAALTGDFADAVERAALTLNVIVFGVDEGALPAIVRDAWSRVPGVEAGWRR
jgi:hypothetical protein